MTQRVTIAPAETLDGKVLLSLDFTKDEDIAIIDDFRKNKREVRAVVTRNTAEKEKKENEELCKEIICMALTDNIYQIVLLVM